MNILILNWRDFKNPYAGGAELLTHEMAKRWVRAGHNVTLFTSLFRGSLPEENIDGVAIIRRGKWWSVYIKAFYYYLSVLKGNVDIVVDEAHWFPFFSVLYARGKVVLLVCEVAKRLFYRLFPFPVAIFGRMIEKLYFNLYRSVPVLAISPSTKHDLIGEGIDETHITVFPMGFSVPKNIKSLPKEKTPAFLFVGRIHPLKGVIDAVEAMAIIRARLPQAKLWIVGKGDPSYTKVLHDRINQLDINDHVQFFGYVPETEKFMIYQRAHLLLVPSVQEGWGLVVVEAASMGTPAVGYRTAGVQDVIVDGKTGILVASGQPEELAAETLKLWKDQIRYRRYQTSGIKRAAAMNWDDTARVALTVLQQTYENQTTSHH